LHSGHTTSGSSFICIDIETDGTAYNILRRTQSVSLLSIVLSADLVPPSFTSSQNGPWSRGVGALPDSRFVVSTRHERRRPRGDGGSRSLGSNVRRAAATPKDDRSPL